MGKLEHNFDTWRLDTLAILFNIPYALLMWSYVFIQIIYWCMSNHIFHLSLLSFIVAFRFICFSFSNWTTHSLIGVVSIAVICLWSLALYIQWLAKVTGDQHHLQFPQCVGVWKSCKDIFSQKRSQYLAFDRDEEMVSFPLGIILWFQVRTIKGAASEVWTFIHNFFCVMYSDQT